MLSGIVARLRSLWDGVRRRDRIEASMDDEFRLHLELRAQDLVRHGLTPEQATRQARLEFGSTEQYKDEARGARGLRRIDQLRFSWLDLKLGVRMLVRYPGLTLVGGSAIAFAIWVGAVMFECLSQVGHPELPLRGGDRLGYATLMLAVCLLACLVPTRRALRVQPTEALRADD
ncbi:MAG TPA: permease prefix domain 1-containing protein [Gemmatimonadaceae bacterium]